LYRLGSVQRARTAFLFTGIVQTANGPERTCGRTRFLPEPRLRADSGSPDRLADRKTDSGRRLRQNRAQSRLNRAGALPWELAETGLHSPVPWDHRAGARSTVRVQSRDRGAPAVHSLTRRIERHANERPTARPSGGPSSVLAPVVRRAVIDSSDRL
jgi:hypothetical protein